MSFFALLLAAAFAWAALAKTVRFGAWRAALDGYRLPSFVRNVSTVAVPMAEAAAAVLLVAGGDASRAGAALSLALLAGFSLVVLRARRSRGDRLPCGCFGGSGSRDYRLMLVRNSSLAAVAAAVLLAPARFELNAPGIGELVPALAVVVGLALIGWLGVTLGKAGR